MLEKSIVYKCLNINKEDNNTQVTLEVCVQILLKNRKTENKI